MEEVNFEGLSKKITTIIIDGKLLKIKPKRKHAEIFAAFDKDKFEAGDAADVTNMLIEMITTANPDKNIEDVEAFVVANYGILFIELAPLFGFASRIDMENRIEKIKELSGKKIEGSKDRIAKAKTEDGG